MQIWSWMILFCFFFLKVNSELWLCIACLCPNNSFFTFDNNKLIRSGKYLSQRFFTNKSSCTWQLNWNLYIWYAHEWKFWSITGLNDLLKKLVVTKKNKIYPLLCKFMTLIDSSRCYCYYWESIFSNNSCQDLTTQSNSILMVQW